MGVGADPANVTLLTPSSGMIGRALQVQISTVSTLFLTNPPTIDFGDPNITVAQTKVDSDDNLRVSINIAPSAKFGAHTVTVTTGGQTLQLVGGFAVTPELIAEPVMKAPTVPQGGMVVYNLRNEDYVSNPFIDLAGAQTLSGSALYTPNDLLPIGLVTGGLSTGRISAIELVDPLAATGPAVAMVQGHDPFGSAIGYYVDPADPSLPQITARTPTPVTLGATIAVQSFPAPGATNLYAFNAAANSVLVAQYSNLGTCFIPGFNQIIGQMAPGSGHFQDGQPLSTVSYLRGGAPAQASLALLGMAGTTYISSFRNDGGGAATGCNYDVKFQALPTAAFSAKEPTSPDTPTKPLATLNLSTTTALMATDGTIDANPDFDYFQYNLAAPADVFILVIPKSNSPAGFAANVQIYSDSKCSVPVTVQGFSNVIHDTAQAGALSRCFSIQGFNPSDTYTIIFVAQ